MAIQALVAGAIFREPEQCTSKAGKPFVTATIKCKDGENVQSVRVVAFAEVAQSELMLLTDGDALSVQGSFKAETFEKDGQARISLSIIADNVLALRQPGRKKAEIPASARPFQPLAAAQM